VTAHHRDRAGPVDRDRSMKYVAAGMNRWTEARHRQGGHRHRRAAQEDEPALQELQGDRQVGSISANSDRQHRQIIADAMTKVGKEGVITVEDGKSLDNELDVVEACSSTAATSRPTSSTTGSQMPSSRTVRLLHDKKISTSATSAVLEQWPRRTTL